MVILIKKRHRSLPVATARVRGILKTVAGLLQLKDKEISVLFTTDEEIGELNREYRGKNGATDVLSFPLDTTTCTALGDIVISVDTAQREALAADISLDDMIDALLIHGLLHLLGYDHVGVSRAQAKEMRAKEDALFFAIKNYHLTR
ncbi:MAG: rRNA maturation RNase YbeY [Deltaproteobacteria bacterium]|nr:rRNA maturation RNase YbeY [Deltaproteobacteria bacterium]